MGSVRPARRFDAHRALGTGTCATGSLRPAAPLALSLSCRGPSRHPRTVPPTRRPARRTMLPSLGFLAVRHVPGRRTRLPRSLPAPQRAASEVWVPPSRRAPPSLRTPCGARASIGFTLQGLLLASSAPPLGGRCPRGVARVDSPRPPGERADAVGFRASIPARMRSGRRVPKDPARRCLPGFLPPERSPPPSWGAAFHGGASPRTRWAVRRPGGACVSGSCGAEGWAGPSRGRRLSWVSSPYDRRGHVPTGAEGGLMASPRGAPRCRRCAPLLAPSRPARPARCADPWSAVLR